MSSNESIHLASEMVTILIGLGSNLGDSIQNLQWATDLLSESVKVQAASRLVRSDPMYVTDQPAFINAALLAQTTLGPREVIKEFKRIEGLVGRVARSKNGPREIDIDLVAYGSLSYRFSDEVYVPHPKLAERRFVLLPLMDVAPAFTIPRMGKVEDLLKETKDQSNSVQWIANAQISIPS